MRCPVGVTSTRLPQWTDPATKALSARLYPAVFRLRASRCHERTLSNRSDKFNCAAQCNTSDGTLHRRPAHHSDDRSASSCESPFLAGQSCARKKCRLLQPVCNFHVDPGLTPLEQAIAVVHLGHDWLGDICCLLQCR